MADTASDVRITDQQPTTLDPNPRADVTPTGFAALTETRDGVLRGSAGADRATLLDLARDTDQVLNLGAGNDIFVFRSNADGANNNINGIVEGGAGTDQVFLAGTLADYVFAVRGDGSIKIQYVADADQDGAAVTFKSFESFTFRNIAADGTNFLNETFTYDALRDAILAAADPVS